MTIEEARKRRYEITYKVIHANRHGQVLSGKNAEIDMLNKIIGEHNFINHPYHDTKHTTRNTGDANTVSHKPKQA